MMDGCISHNGPLTFTVRGSCFNRPAATYDRETERQKGVGRIIHGETLSNRTAPKTRRGVQKSEPIITTRKRWRKWSDREERQGIAKAT